MAEQNTPLINELLEQLGHHPDLENWRQKARIPADIVKQLCLTLKTDSRYSGQPSRFYASAIALVNYTYKSWLALMKRLQSQLDSKTYWLEMLKSDAELVKICSASLDGICTKATEILAQIAPVDTIDTQQPKTSKVKKSKKSALSQTDGVQHTPQTSDRHLFNTLFEIYRNTEDILIGIVSISGVMADFECIQTQATKAGIVIEQGKQPIRGSPQQKAKELAIAAYKSRQIAD